MLATGERRHSEEVLGTILLVITSSAYSTTEISFPSFKDREAGRIKCTLREKLIQI